MVALREILMTLVLVFLGEVEEMGMGANETVGGGGGRGGGVHKGIRDAADADLYATCSTGVCEPDFSPDVDSDISDNFCTAESDISP